MVSPARSAFAYGTTRTPSACNASFIRARQDMMCRARTTEPGAGNGSLAARMFDHVSAGHQCVAGWDTTGGQGYDLTAPEGSSERGHATVLVCRRELSGRSHQAHSQHELFRWDMSACKAQKLVLRMRLMAPSGSLP